MKRLLIVTDAWEPQTNGVVTTLQSVIEHLPGLGYEVQVIHPGMFKTRPLLTRRGVANLVVWGRGVDTERFRPRPPTPCGRPRLLYVGRVAAEKNLEAFLSLPLDADKVVVGDGPARADLEPRFPDARWLGYRHGDALVAEYADADVFVFPSRTDTFGLVMLEAMACGTPVAGYPVTGPRDVVTPGVNGALDDDLTVAVRRGLMVDRERCRRSAEEHGWARVALRMAHSLTPAAPSPQIARACRA
jgi:glycosyltransferase involved in cell wall biosynthesis